VAYRADIEIGVKGTRQLEQLRSLITQTTQAYESLNRIAKTRGGLVQNLANYTTQVDRARKAIDNATMGSKAETKAIREYVTAMGQANTARARQNYLIEQEIANRRRVQATMNAGFGQQGPAVPPSMRNAGFGQFGPALPPRAGAARPGAGIGKGIMGAASNAAIGGAFPLLFGQSGAAAAGGALGGIAGSFLGPSGGFAGSLVGTILGEKLGQGNQVKQLGEDIGFSTEQTKMLGTAFQQAGRDFDKFQQSVSTIQGLSLSIEDQGRAIQLASTLTENYGGKIDKVTDAFAKALSTGKVTQGTLDQLTKQNIQIQQALADKYGVSRSAILQMAKDGKISVQDLIDTLVKVGNEGTKSATSQQKAFNDAYTSIEEAGNRLATTISNVLGTTADDINNKLNKVLLDTLTYISDLIDGFNEVAKVVGPVVKFIVDKYIAINTAIWNTINSIPGLTQGILQFAATVLGPLGQVAYLMNSIRGVGAAAKGKLPPPPPKPKLESFAAPAQFVPDSKNTAADKAAKAAELEAARVANIVRDRAAEMEIMRMQLIFAEQIAVAEINKDPILKSQLQTTEKINEISINYSKAINDERAKGNSIAAKEAITKKAVAEIDKVNFEGALDIAKIEIQRKENYENLLLDLKYELDLRSAVTEEARKQLEIAYEMEKLKRGKEFTDPQLEEIKRRKQQAAAPKSPTETITGRIGELQDELKKLTDIGNIAITVADGIGNAFGTAFKGLIDGSMSAREALSAFFQDVASMFLEMAAQIIAKQMTMIILQTILKALGAVAGASGGGGFGAGGNSFNANGALPAGTGNIPSLGSSYGFAKGGAFANGITAFASGGIVGSPTLFKFANGGTTQTGLMGEAGPEAIMPLSRSADGKLGVNASGLREAMGGAPGMGGSPVLSMSFETTRFGDTDYVSRDQLEAAMAQTRKQASADGAKRGMSMTLDRLQQSPQTRSRVGLR
jgi:tape measure domain-containing protein